MIQWKTPTLSRYQSIKIYIFDDIIANLREQKANCYIDNFRWFKLSRNYLIKHSFFRRKVAL